MPAPQHLLQLSMQAEEVQTSASRPITVSWVVKSPQGSGQLGLCFCPGKRATRGGIRIERDLHADLCRLQERYGTACVVCLLNDAELRSYGLRDYRESIRRHGLDYVQFPIIECAPPEDMAATAALIDDLAERLARGQVVVAHCRGGVGRAGLVAACLLLRLGQVSSPVEAIGEVRRLRCKAAVETRRQEDFIAQFSQHLMSAATST